MTRNSTPIALPTFANVETSVYVKNEYTMELHHPTNMKSHGCTTCTRRKSRVPAQENVLCSSAIETNTP